MKRLIIIFILVLLVGCERSDGFLKSVTNENTETNNQVVLEEFKMDVNKDGVIDQVRMITSHYDNNPKYFSAPVYLEYRTNPEQPFQKLALDVPPIDLTKRNLKIRTGDLDSNELDEIVYSIDYAQPEYVSRWPHILHYQGNAFIDIDITEVHEVMVEDWDISISQEGLAQLVLHEKKEAHSDAIIRHYELNSNGLLTPIPQIL